MTTSVDVSTKLADRYGNGRRANRRKIVVVAAALVLAAVLGYVAWMTVSRSMSSIDTNTTTWRLIDDRTIEVSFTATGPREKPIACAVEAQDGGHAVVGWKVVTAEPTSDHTRSFVVTLPTVDTPVTGFVAGCWIP